MASTSTCRGHKIDSGESFVNLMQDTERGKLRPSDSGFGMVEVLIAMFLVAIIAVAFLPVLIKGLQAASLNTNAAAATQIVNKELTSVSGLATPLQCSDTQLQSFMSGKTFTQSAHSSSQPALRVTLSATNPSTAGLCSIGSTAHGTLTLRVTVTNDTTGKLYSSASTIVRVAS